MMSRPWACLIVTNLGSGETKLCGRTASGEVAVEAAEHERIHVYGEARAEARAKEHREDRRRMGGAANPGAVSHHAGEGHRARLHRRVCSHEDLRRLSLCLLWRGAFQLGDEVRLWHGLAELLGAGLGAARPPGGRQQLVYAAHRGRV